jgi:hypothetical protein
MGASDRQAPLIHTYTPLFTYHYTTPQPNLRLDIALSRSERAVGVKDFLIPLIVANTGSQGRKAPVTVNDTTPKPDPPRKMLKQKNIALSLQTADRRKKAYSSGRIVALMLREMVIRFLSRLRGRQRRIWKDLET